MTASYNATLVELIQTVSTTTIWLTTTYTQSCEKDRSTSAGRKGQKAKGKIEGEDLDGASCFMQRRAYRQECGAFAPRSLCGLAFAKEFLAGTNQGTQAGPGAPPKPLSN